MCNQRKPQLLEAASNNPSVEADKDLKQPEHALISSHFVRGLLLCPEHRKVCEGPSPAPGLPEGPSCGETVFMMGRHFTR